MPIYTKTGDRGKTSLFSGKRVWKHDLRVEAYGTVDELNPILGLALAALPHKKNKQIAYLRDLILEVQKSLFYIGSYFADLPDTLEEIDLIGKTNRFEKEIDLMTNKMPKLANFIFLDGGLAGSFLQNARAIARRAERQIVKLSKKEKIDVRLLKYINRLSDLFFTMARYANHIEGKKERIWER